MDDNRKQAFVRKMRKRKGFYSGGVVKGYAGGGQVVGGALGGAASGAAIGSVIPGVGTAIGAIGGGIAGLIGGLFGGSGPTMPNITDPVTGAQITDANGRVIASQQQLTEFANSLKGANGIGAQQSVMQHLQDISEGRGPNPAQTMLNQATGTNVSNAAALAAGQRGAASNVGLIARQVGQNAAATQQAAVGQAATLQAQQQVNALTAEGAVAGQVVGEQQGALDAAAQSALGNQGQILGAQGEYNKDITGGQGNVNTNNTAITDTLIPQVGSVVKGGLSGLGAAGVADAGSGGASIPEANRGGPSSKITPFARGGRVLDGPHGSHVANFLHLAKGGKVPAKVSPGEIYLSPDKVQKVMEGGNPLKVGERISGKAKVKGDSKKNDIVDRTLEEGGVVVPRSHAMSEEKAALFVHRAMAKKGRRS